MTDIILKNLVEAKLEKSHITNHPKYLNFIQNDDFDILIKDGKTILKAWSKTLDEKTHISEIQSFISAVIISYWKSTHNLFFSVKPLPEIVDTVILNNTSDQINGIAEIIGNAASSLDVINAAFHIGNLYTSLLPQKLRSRNGVFYTPPSLTNRLIEMSENAGVDWAKVSVVDPACGGGAFLAPVALAMRSALKDLPAQNILKHVETHLKGFEIDPFGAWLTQVFLEIALIDVIKEAGRNIKTMVTVCNTLNLDFNEHKMKYDLVIGNPPYGKVKLTDEIKSIYKDSLYGHANLYGLFTHLAIKMVKDNGFISYLTPTSFLSGEYFKNLRSYIRKNLQPTEMDFVSIRKGIFEDVLQETLLTIYRKNSKYKKEGLNLQVNELIAGPNGKFKINDNGSSILPLVTTAPWILPRKHDQISIVRAMEKMKFSLKDWGFKICTGQLVWNRYKSQLTEIYRKGNFPIIWSEAVTQDGKFIHRSEKKNHDKWFSFGEKDQYLLTTESCIILQRTTSKEQSKRLIAAVLPSDFLEKHKAAIIENHLNMIIPLHSDSSINLEVLSKFLNSKATNDAFRTISGSVAVSAYELESLPLPDVSKLNDLIIMVNNGASQELIEIECLNLYTENNHA